MAHVANRGAGAGVGLAKSRKASRGFVDGRTTEAKGSGVATTSSASYQ